MKTVVRGTHDEQTLDQMQEVAVSAAYTAIMADGHVGYHMPIGGVAAYRNAVSPSGVGVDIACGNAAIKTNMTVDEVILKYLPEIADEVASSIGFGMGTPNNPTKVAYLKDHPIFGDPRWDLIPSNIRGNLRDQARAQLGTVGGGNHYLDIFTDEEGCLWVGCHFGSRGFGFQVSNGMILQSVGEK